MAFFFLFFFFQLLFSVAVIMSKAIRLLEILVRFNGFKEETGEHTEKVNPKHIIVVLIN